jgi:hypothetical protein
VFGNDVIRGGGRVKGRDRGELTKGNKKLSQRYHNPPIIYEPPSPKIFLPQEAASENNNRTYLDFGAFVPNLEALNTILPINGFRHHSYLP